jgi:hypothetical protein
MLLTEGANVLLRSHKGDSAIDLAVMGNKHSIVKMLAAAGANPRDELVTLRGTEVNSASSGAVLETSSSKSVSAEERAAAARARMKEKLAQSKLAQGN